MKCLWAALLLVLLLVGSGLAQSESSAADSLGIPGLDLLLDREWLVQASPEIQLPEFPLDPASLVVRAEGRRLEPGVDYLLEAHSGRIQLLSSGDLGKTLLINWRVIRLSLPATESLHPEGSLPWVGPEGVEEDSLAPALDPLDGDGENTLRYSGSFLRAIRVGGGSGVGMESGLRLQVEGQLGRNVDVEAFLSDRSTPLLPEGRSESLEEIDRIHVSVRSPHWHTLMGDFDLSLADRHYLEYQRTVDGLEGGWRDRDNLLRAWGALARGRTRRLELAGQDGVQGPWQLLSDQGRDDILVLAGSERVWLDGLPVSRGEDRDYTIDYSLGQLHFTARRPITADTRITVEYQYSERVYNRRLLGLEGQASQGNFSVTVAAASERDDPDNPLDQFLGDEDRLLLAQAGDSPEGRLGSGARLTDPGDGSYRRLSDEGQWGRYEFNEDPPDSLAAEYIWELRFTELGRDSQGQFLGDYERRFTTAGRPWWSFVGERAGAWAPVVPLAAPQQLDVVDLVTRWQPGIFRLELESAVSRQDLNLFSGEDDQDNLGGALRLGLGLQGRRALALGRVPLGRPRLNATFAGERAEFRSFSPSDEIEFERTWGLSRQGAEDLLRLDLEAAIEQGDSLAQRARVSLLDRGDLTSRMLSLRNRFSPLRHTRVDHEGSWRRLREGLRRSDWQRVSGGVEQDLGPNTLRAGLDSETSRELPAAASASGLRHTEWQLAGWRPLGDWLTLRLDGSRRLRQTLEGTPGWQDLSTTDTGRLRMRLNTGNGLDGETDWSHRETRWARGDSASTVSDLALLDLRLSARDVEGSLLYRAENSLVQDRITQYVQVDSLQGDYSPDPFEPGIFVPDPDGSWVALSYDTGTRRRVAAVSLEGSLRLTPPALPGVASDTHLELEGRGPVSSPARLYTLQPGTVLGDSILSGAIRVRQDLELEDRADRTWRLRWNEEQELDRRQLQNPLRRTLREWGLRCRTRTASTTRVQLEGLRRAQATRYLNTASANREVLAWALEGEITRDLRKDLQVRTTVRGERGREAVLDLLATTLRVDPRLEWRRGIKGSLTLDFSWQQCWSDAERIPYELLNGARVGQTIRAGAEARTRIGRATSFSLSWHMDRLPERQAVHSGRAQIQSFF
ncbi:MAG: hypothetical protein KC518_00780 [Candidatus Cloacimonetes bacterium]|nr:hypothetical protein [Candidatus Cloacimonadota bacterium]